MKRYKETKSRNSTTKDFGDTVQVRVKIPANTCHPGANVQFRSQANPPSWHCDKCGKLLLLETPVNAATVFEDEKK